MSICDWGTREKDFQTLSEYIQKQLNTPNTLPSVQPFHSLVLPLSLEEMLQVTYVVQSDTAYYQTNFRTFDVM